MKYSIFLEPPENFHPTVEAAGCYCEYEDTILLLKRHPNSAQGGTWGVPAGKLEKNESPRAAVIREVREEVGFEIDDAGLIEIRKIYVKLPHLDYIFHTFRKHFQKKPQITLQLEECVETKWVTIAEAFTLPLITGGKEALDYYVQAKKVSY